MISALLQDLYIYLTVPVLTLFYWRGTWLLCNHYFYSSDLETSAWCSILIGYGGSAVFFCWQFFFHSSKLSSWFDVNSASSVVGGKSATIWMLSRIETYLVGFLVVNAWRGIWLLQDVYLLTGSPLLSAWTSHIVGCVCLIGLLHFKSVYAPPVIYCRDSDFAATLTGFLSRRRNDDLRGDSAVSTNA